MKFLAGLFGLVTLAVGVCAPATAQDTTTIYAKVATSYVMQDLALEASPEPSLQAGVTRTYGKWSTDVWTATELSGSGRYGERGYGDEIDLTVLYNDTAETPFGALTFEGSASYYLLSSFGDSRDDMLQLYADVGLPLQWGSVTITPFVRPMQWVGFGAIPDESLVRAGARFSAPITNDWSVDGDVSANFLLTSDKSHARSQVNLTKDLGDGAVFRIESKFTEGAPAVFSIGGAKTF